MTQLNLRNMPGLATAVSQGRVDLSDRRISLKTIAAVAIAILGWFWALFGAGSGAVAKDYISLRDRVKVLETLRDEDHEWKRGVDQKLDRLLEAVAAARGQR